jgi:xylulokinase
VLPVDANGRPLRPGILYGVDTRAADEIHQLEAALGRDNIFANSALHLSSQAAGPKIRWIRNHEPDVWQQTETILTGSGYLVFKLTGDKTIDHYTATAYAPLYDVHNRRWSAIMAGPITPLDKLPRLLWSVEPAGTVTARAAAQTGLVAGTPVIAGTADAASEALSAGLCQPGDLMVMYGSSIFFIQKTAKLVATEKLWGAVYLEAGTYAVAAGMSTSGSLTRWFRDQFAPEERAVEQAGGANAYAALAAQAANSPIGANGLIALPYFSGERTPINDPHARGLIVGLTLSHTRADVYRALLEGVSYGIRHNIEAMRDEGVPPQRILAVGGGTKNRLWLQMVSDIAGIQQVVPRQHWGACYGDALMAGVGIGLFPNTTHAAEWVQAERVIEPDEAARRAYQPYYDLYREVYENTKHTMHRLAQLSGV